MEHMPTRQSIRHLLFKFHQTNGALFDTIVFPILTSVCRRRRRALLSELLSPLFIRLFQEHLEHVAQACDVVLAALDLVVTLREVRLHPREAVPQLVPLHCETGPLPVVGLDLLLQRLDASLEAATFG